LASESLTRIIMSDRRILGMNAPSDQPAKLLVNAKGGNIHSARLEIPGDKSISHRAIILGSLSEGTTSITNCLMGADVVSTINVFRELGVRASVSGTSVEVGGVGLYGLKSPGRTLDAGNAGTCMRLVSGVLAGQSFRSVFVGDESLSRRPMRRIITPLELMGAQVHATEAGTAPLEILGKRPLKAIHYRSPVASAQVKSGVLLAGLYADGPTSVTESHRTRDHTERMLSAFGVPIEVHGSTVTVTSRQPAATCIEVPGDISSAAFFIVAGLLSRDAEIEIANVGLNPLRTGCIQILRAMGGDVTVLDERVIGGEPVGTLRVRSSCLHGIEVDPTLVASAIDEFPIIFVAAAFASGNTLITGASELRVKESDRIATMVNGLRSIGIQAVARPDGAMIIGRDEAEGSATIETYFDHRVAMAFAVASMRTRMPIVIKDADSIFTSFPTFFDLAGAIGLQLERSAG
jgi:3-phosphoshikimate 1-carboxyvinyltransferase